MEAPLSIQTEVWGIEVKRPEESDAEWRIPYACKIWEEDMDSAARIAIGHFKLNERGFEVRAVKFTRASTTQ
jgi:hypothetical protein